MYAKTILLLSIAICLSGCATRLTLISPPVSSDLLTRCEGTVAPLTSGDQYDIARALTETNQIYKDCKAKQNALVDAVLTREQVINSVRTQLETK